MAQNRQSLEQLEGIGRGEMIAKDPLGFSGVILKNVCFASCQQSTILSGAINFRRWLARAHYR